MHVDIYDVDRERDLSKNRVVKLEDGTKVIIRMTDPYGYWSIHYEKGRIPEDLKGSFTDFNMAVQKVKTYFQSKGKAVDTVSKGFGIEVKV